MTYVTRGDCGLAKHGKISIHGLEQTLSKSGNIKSFVASCQASRKINFYGLHPYNISGKSLYKSIAWGNISQTSRKLFPTIENHRIYEKTLGTSAAKDL